MGQRLGSETLPSRTQDRLEDSPGHCRRQLNTDQRVATRELIIFPETLALIGQGRKQVLDVENWAEISRLRRSEGMSISQVSRVVGLARNTVKTALNNESPPGYRREPAGSRVDGFGPRIRKLLQA